MEAIFIEMNARRFSVITTYIFKTTQRFGVTLFAAQYELLNGPQIDQSSCKLRGKHSWISEGGVPPQASKVDPVPK